MERVLIFSLIRVEFELEEVRERELSFRLKFLCI